MTKDEALKMAIEAIEYEGVRDSEDYWLMMDKVRTACKEALAELQEQKHMDKYIYINPVTQEQYLMTKISDPNNIKPPKKATEVKTHTDWLEYQHEQLERAAEREMELMKQIKKLLHIIVEQGKKLNESALERMAENAQELGLDYCKHGSDSACKECYTEKIK